MGSNCILGLTAPQEKTKHSHAHTDTQTHTYTENRHVGGCSPGPLGLVKGSPPPGGDDGDSSWLRGFT